MNHTTRSYQVVLFILALGLSSGCDASGPKRSVVSGKVSYQGEPVHDGIIRFVPIEGTKGPVSGAVIEDGVYTAKAGGGSPVGKLRVEIQAFQESVNSARREGPDLADNFRHRKQFLPPKYNLQSELTVTIEPAGRQTRDFELQ